MIEQATIWQRHLRAFQSLQRTLFARSDQQVALLLLLVLLFGGEPVSCMLHCGSTNHAAPAGNHAAQDVTFHAEPHATSAPIAPIPLLNDVAEQSQYSEGSQPQSPATSQEHEHLAVFLFALVVVVVRTRLQLLQHLPLDLPTLRTPPWRRPPILALCPRL